MSVYAPECQPNAISLSHLFDGKNHYYTRTLYILNAIYIINESALHIIIHIEWNNAQYAPQLAISHHIIPHHTYSVCVSVHHLHRQREGERDAGNIISNNVFSFLA